MMDFTGRLGDIRLDIKTRKPILCLIIDQSVPDDIGEIADKELKIKIGRNSKKRSIDSNAYFHVLCDKLRQRMGVSMAYMKNVLITSYGQVWYLNDNEPFVYKTNAPPEFMMEREEIHSKYFMTSNDGAHWYRIYRGSHTYTAAEMNQLITGTIYECKQAGGIETATPDELKRMAALWEKRRGKE